VAAAERIYINEATEARPIWPGFFCWLKGNIMMISKAALEADEADRVLFGIFAPYLVGIGFATLQSDKNAKPHADCHFRSGFILDFGGTWFWVTAGHVIEEIIDARRRGVQIVDICFWDQFGNDDVSYPFDFFGAWKHYENNITAGIDYGAVELAPHEQKILEHSGIRPVQEWGAGRQTGHYVIVGLPEEDTRRSVEASRYGFRVSGKPTLAINYVKRLKRAPKGFRNPSPRLVGRLARKWPGQSMKGTSGGPVFEIDPDCLSSVRVVGLQSDWDRATRTVFGCPIEFFGPRLRAAIDARLGTV
jgi:hypothetical protein